MTAKSEASKAIDKAFRAAILLTGSTELAENAVLDGIAASEFGHIVDDVLLETVKSAIQRRAAFSDQSAQAPSDLPLELRRLFLLAPISRDSFVLRVLLGMPPATCSRILRLGIDEFEDVLCAALQELPFLEAYSSIRREIIHPAQTQDSSTTCRTTSAEECTNPKGA
jgi:hypothetical protein